jgi:hypothetical protein
MSKGFPEMRNRQIYLTAMLAATPAAAVAAILAATPTASPVNIQLSFNAAIPSAPLDPCDLDPNCNAPGFPGNGNNPDNIPGNANPFPAPGNVNPDPVPDIVASDI